MDEKVIEMLGKLFEGQTEIKSQMTDVKSQMTDVKSQMAEMKSQMVRMEIGLGGKIDVLFDAQKVQQDVNDRILERLDRLEAKVDKLELQTAHVRLVK